MNKLEVFVDFLREYNFSKEEIDKVIVRYFDNSDSEVFELEGQGYQVLTFSEIKSKLRSVCNEIFEDTISEMKYYLRNFDYKIVDCIIDNISMDGCISDYEDEISFEDQFEVTLVYEDRYNDVFIYEIN